MKKLRFAPSPTGFLHLGNARTALICYLFAKKHEGKFILRIDDTDQERCKNEYIEQFLQDLAWLGLNHDEQFQQSQRYDLYNRIIEKMKQDGDLYPCFEAKDELELKRTLQLKNKKPPIYDRECLGLSPAKQEKYRGRTPHWRFKLDHSQPIKWHDGAKKNDITFDPAKLSDPIVIRENGVPTYLLISVIDDADMAITDVVRGEDHISNTATQIQMFERLDAKIPNFFHLPLIKHDEGKISKRVGGLEIKHLQQFEPIAINNYLHLMGQSTHDLHESLEKMGENFDIGKFSASSTLLNLQDLQSTNAELLKLLPYSEVAKRLNVEEKLWNLIKNNVELLDEAHEWQKIFSDEFEPTILNEEIAKIALDLLDKIDDYQSWIEKIVEKTSAPKREIIQTIRVALTGRKSGPKLPEIFEFLGKNGVEKRMQA